MSDLSFFGAAIVMFFGFMLVVLIVVDTFIYDMWRDEWRWKRRKSRTHPTSRERHIASEALLWKVQHASYHPQEGSGLLHVARSQHGIFEIFEDGPHYLLHAPRSMKLPAELFGSLSAAKAHADSLIPTPSPQ